MIEIISKLCGIFKVSAIPLFLLTAVHSTRATMREDKSPEIENTVPGDNFPYAVMSRGI